MSFPLVPIIISANVIGATLGEARAERQARLNRESGEMVSWMRRHNFALMSIVGTIATLSMVGLAVQSAFEGNMAKAAFYGGGALTQALFTVAEGVLSLPDGFTSLNNK